MVAKLLALVGLSTGIFALEMLFSRAVADPACPEAELGSEDEQGET